MNKVDMCKFLMKEIRYCETVSNMFGVDSEMGKIMIRKRNEFAEIYAEIFLLIF